MNPLATLAQQFQIPSTFLEKHKIYVGITAKQMDSVVASQGVDVFATQSFSNANADNKVYNDRDTAFAVAVVTYLLIQQDIEVFQRVAQLNPQQTAEQKYGIDLLRYIIYQLDKKEPMVYLNTLLANKNIPNQPIQQGVEFSKIYSFVHLCQLASYLKPLQMHLDLKYYGNHNELANFTNDDSDLPVLYQPSKSAPVLVIFKSDLTELQLTIFHNHLKFMREIAIQLTLDGATQKLSYVSESLKFQPYKFQSLDELTKVIFAGQPNIEDRYNKFVSLPKIAQTFSFLIDPQFTVQQAKEQLIKDQEQEVAKEIQSNQPNQGQTHFDPFRTQVAPTTQQAAMRKTQSY